MQEKLENILQEFRKEIIALRKANGYTQKFVAESIGIKTQCYQAYESGVSVPTFQNFIKLALFFELSPNELLGID